MRPVIAASILLLLTGAAYAQAPSINMGADKPKDPLKEMKDEEIDRAYRDATRGGKPAAPAANDPWAAVRAAEQPARPAAKTPQKPQKQSQKQPQTQPR